MKLHLPEVLKGAFARTRSAVLALMTAVVGAVALIAWRVHFVFEFLAAEVFFALLFLALLLIIGTLYLVGAAAASPSVPRASENVKRNITLCERAWRRPFTMWGWLTGLLFARFLACSNYSHSGVLSGAVSQ